MNKKSKFFFTVFLAGISCCLWSQQKVDDTRPMYGEVAKDERYQKVDNEFRKDMTEKFGSADSAAHEYVNMAWALFYRKDLKNAMRRFNQAWLLNPEYPDPYFGFAALLEVQREQAEATRFYLKGTEKDKDKRRQIVCFQHISACKEQLNDLEGAIEALMKINLIKPDDPALYRRLGYLYLKNRNNDLAEKAYTKAITLDPGNAEAFNDRAKLYLQMEDYLKAMFDYDKSISLDPTVADFYKDRGILELKTGNFDVAIKDFNSGIKLEPKSGELWKLLGLAKLNLDERQGACEDFRKAKELGDPMADEIMKEYCR